MLALACAIAMCGWATPSYAKLTNAHTVWHTFKTDEIIELATEMGNTAKVDTTSSEPAVIITTPEGFVYSANAVACESDGCYGLLIQASFTNANPVVDTNWLNSFNLKHVFTSAMLSGGNIVLVRYEICDFGITKGDVASDFVNLRRSARHLLDGLGRSGWQ